MFGPFLFFLKVDTDELSKIKVEWVAVDFDILFNARMIHLLNDSDTTKSYSDTAESDSDTAKSDSDTTKGESDTPESGTAKSDSETTNNDILLKGFDTDTQNIISGRIEIIPESVSLSPPPA